MKKVFSILFKILKITFFVLFSLVALSSVYRIFCNLILKQPYPMFFNYSYSVIISQSMEPTLYVGDMIFVERCDDYQVGDIVVFDGVMGTTAHTVYQKTQNGYVTWGDNRSSNPVPDNEISSDKVYGKVVNKVSKIGYLFLFFKSLPGIVCLVITLLGFIFIPSFVNNYFDKLEQQEKEKREQIKTQIIQEVKQQQDTNKQTLPNETIDKQNTVDTIENSNIIETIYKQNTDENK